VMVVRYHFSCNFFFHVIFIRLCGLVVILGYAFVKVILNESDFIETILTKCDFCLDNKYKKIIDILFRSCDRN